MSRPLLGVLCCVRQFEGEPIHRVIDRYIRAPATYTGAEIVLVPALAELADQRELARRLDGLLLTGSTSNVEPWRYGGRGDHGPFDPARDSTSLALAAAMLDAQKPVFGICRGFQELNVTFGGTLRHLGPGQPLAHHAPDGVSIEAMFGHGHSVTPVPGGIIAGALGEAPMTVNSVHFEAVDRLAPGLVPEAYAGDNLIEAYSTSVGRANVLAVQWHPEWDAATNPASRWFFRALGDAMGADGSGQDLADGGLIGTRDKSPPEADQ